MHVDASGPPDAPAVLFLHGSGATADLWRRHAEYFAAYRCLMPDLPGFGDSADEPWLSIAATAAELAALLAGRTAGKTHVVGISLGGALTMQLIATRPDLIDHAVVDGAGALPIAGWPLARPALYALQPFLKTDLVTAAIAGALGFPKGAVDGLRSNFRRMSSRAFVRAISDALDFREPTTLAQSRVSTLFVAGAREPKATLRSNADLAARMPQATARIVPGLHHGWIANDPRLHCRMVDAWINDRPLPVELAEPR